MMVFTEDARGFF